MKSALFIIAIIAVVAGGMFIFTPKLLAKTGDTLNRVFAMDDIIFSRRLFFGVLLLAISAYFFYQYYQVTHLTM